MAWIIDTSHSAIQFSVKHLGISTVRGTFTSFTGTIDADEQNPTAAKVDVQIETASINTRDEKRDAHLRSPDFFDVEKFPTLTFKSTKVQKVSKTKLKITGDLTMHGVTKPVTLDAEISPEVANPFSGNPTRAVTATGVIVRQEWNLKWQAPAEAVKVVGDEVKISIEAELVIRPAAPPATK